MEVYIVTRKYNSHATCIYGVAVAFGDSIARLVVENKQIAITKGTDSINGLLIEQAKGRTTSYLVPRTSYRIFIKFRSSDLY